jgi:uncharacterized protein (DUF1778 family)|tara:strand:- start:2077 stop:2256 length:180 start_codon:yes stop_codon:yes gene_type:complete
METQIQYKITDEDKKIIREACDLMGNNMSNFSRTMALREARKILLENKLKGVDDGFIKN